MFGKIASMYAESLTDKQTYLLDKICIYIGKQVENSTT